MIVEVLQHGMVVQTLLKVLLSTSSWSLKKKKKKSPHLLLSTFKDIHEPNQHFDVL